MHRPQTPQPGFGSITLLQNFTPHFKILDPRLALSEDFILNSVTKNCCHFFCSLDLAIFCCNVSEDSIDAVKKVFHDIAPKLNFSAIPAVKNLPPDRIKEYLKGVHLKTCVLVVDGKTVKDAHEKQTEGEVEYQGLLETAAKKGVN